MSSPPSQKNSPKKEVERRRVMADGASFLLGALIVPPFLRGLVTVRPKAPRIEEKAPRTIRSRDATKKKKRRKIEPIDPLFEQFVGEELIYEVNFLWTFHAADVTVSLRRGAGPALLAEINAVARGIIGWASNMKRQVFKTRLIVVEEGGRKRLLATRFSRISEKGKTIRKSVHRFDYKKNRWTYIKYVNGKRKKRRTKKIPPGVRYEDFAGFMYNLRAGFYGKMEPGHSFTIRTVPFKGIDRYELRVATQKEMDKEKKWIKKVPGATKMGIVKIHQKVFGIKTGEARVLTDDAFVPLAAKVKDAVTFGDVTLKLTRKKKNPH